MTVVTLGYSRRATSAKTETAAAPDGVGSSVLHPLAKQSCHLLLVLTTQSTGFIAAVSGSVPTDSDGGGVATEGASNSSSGVNSSAVTVATVSRSIFRDIGSNPYREALFALTPLSRLIYNLLFISR